MENETSAFRGVAGEVVRGFVHAATLATIVAVMFMMALAALAVALVIKVTGVPEEYAVLLLMVGASPIVGRFALAARIGHLDAGLLTTEVSWGSAFQFGARHAALCLAWGLPLAFVAQRIIKGGDGMAGMMPSQGALLGLVVVGAASLAAQVLSLLVATRTESLGEAFSGDAWRWVLVDRRGDLVPFLAALIGGVTVFALLLWPVLGVLSLILLRAAPAAGAALGAFTYAAPMMAAPILLGRLCGAFTFGDERLAPPAPVFPAAGSVPRAPTAPAAAAPVTAPAMEAPRVLTPVTAPPVRTAVQAARRMEVGEGLDGIAVKAESDVASATKDAELLRAAHPANPRVALVYADLLKRSGRDKEAAAAAGQAIKVALSAGAAPLAIETWTSYAAARDGLDLDAGALEALGRQLTTRKSLRDASWCFATMKPKGAEPLRVQRGLISVAEAAAADGHAASAAQIYRYILKEYPESTLREYMQNAIAQLDPGSVPRGAPAGK